MTAAVGALRCPVGPQKVSFGAAAVRDALYQHGLGRKGWVCRPSEQRLAEHLSVSVRTVRRYLAELVRSGFLVIQRDGRTSTNIYHRFVERTPVAPGLSLSERAGRKRSRVAAATRCALRRRSPKTPPDGALDAIRKCDTPETMISILRRIHFECLNHYNKEVHAGRIKALDRWAKERPELHKATERLIDEMAIRGERLF